MANIKLKLYLGLIFEFNVWALPRSDLGLNQIVKDGERKNWFSFVPHNVPQKFLENYKLCYIICIMICCSDTLLWQSWTEDIWFRCVEGFVTISQQDNPSSLDQVPGQFDQENDYQPKIFCSILSYLGEERRHIFN